MDFILEEKHKNILIIILSIVILLLTVFLLVFNKNKECEVVEKQEEVILEKEVVNEELVEEIEYVVDVKGAVKKSGVYKIKKGAIVDDVLKMAGLKSNASTVYINLSYELKDHDVIYIYTNTEVKNKNIKETCVCNNIDISDCVDSGIVSNGNINSTTNVSGKVNINTASLEELLSLDGVGESKALAIIEYRKTNKFNTIEDIKNVSGIGDSVYNKIKDNITV